MSPTHPDRRRRARKATLAGVAGLVGVSAAVALPALAAERGDSGAQDASAVAEPTLTPEEQVLEELSKASPQQLDFLVWVSMTDEQRDFIRFTTATEEERDFIAFVSAPEEVRQAFVEALRPKPAPKPAPRQAQQAPRASQPAPSSAPAPAPAAGGGGVWDRLAQCESGGNWSANTGNGYYGGVQFSHSTWVAVGGRQYAEYPHQASRDQQIAVAQRLQSSSGWGQWPSCSRKLGLR
jgi:hypothetical protein